MFVYMLVQIIN